MSIANKLIYLNGTKEKLKDGINNIGGSITDETTFRAYAEELDNIYSSLPKTTGEGSNLSLTTLKGRINVDDILGDTKQEGTPTPSSPQDINVVTGTQEVVVQNKNLAYIEAEGKYRSSASGNFSINANYNGYIAKVSQNTTYSGSFTNMASNYNDVSNLCYFDKNMNFISGNSYNTANKTFTTPSNCAYATMAVKTTIIDFQVEYGSTASTYTPHQEQTKTLHLSSSNLCNLNLNTTTIAGVTLTKNSDNTITANGTATSTIAVNILNNNGGTSTDNLTLPKGTYTLSGCPTRW